MQATRTLGGQGFSKSGVGVVVAIATAFALGAGGGYAARSIGSAAPATHGAGTVSVLHQQAPDAAERNAHLGLQRGVGPVGQLGDVSAGSDPNRYVGAPTRAVVPAVDPAAGYDISKYLGAQFDPSTWYQDWKGFGNVPADDRCVYTSNRHKAC